MNLKYKSLRRVIYITLSFLGSIAFLNAENCPSSSFAKNLIKGARQQIGTTKYYDPQYVKLTYPNGDVSRDRGVCTDVLIRAYRDAFQHDLQKSIHEDMKSNFSSYPKIWGLSRPDKNIDHRRVPNMQTFFTRKGKHLPSPNKTTHFCPGDIVTQMLPGNLPHILIVSDKRSNDGNRPLVIHNIGRGTQEEDTLFEFPMTGHYRFYPQ